MKPLVYVIGPYETGDHLRNTKRAIDAGDFVISQGGIAIIPHLSHFHDERSPHSREYWLEMGLALLKTCQYAVRILGHSPGGDAEQAQAIEDSQPVFLLNYLDYNITQDKYIFDFRNPDANFLGR